MANNATFTINFDGNASVVSKELVQLTGQLQGNVIKLQTVFSKSFEETNAAIQVLDKAGKKGAEGGIAFCCYL